MRKKKAVSKSTKTMKRVVNDDENETVNKISLEVNETEEALITQTDEQYVVKRSV